MANICVGITGGIAAFKAVTLVRELGRRGHSVRVAMTRSAQKFVGEATLAGVTGTPVLTELFGVPGEPHVALGDWSDLMVIAPATMNAIAKLAGGLTDDPVLTTASCMRGPILVAPAMHHRMWDSPATQRNIRILREDGISFVGPESGPLASGASGMGRLSEPETIADAAEAMLASSGELSGLRVTITAGPTLEDLDPVRFLGNRSSGKMGYAIARAALRSGASVRLISGPVSLRAPQGVELINVRSALELHAAVFDALENSDVLVMAAAVADYRPKTKAEAKVKKSDGAWSIELVRNPDILAEVGATRAAGSHPGLTLVGFALETSDAVERARGKLERKKADLIVANLAADSFGKDSNRVTFVTRSGANAIEQASKDAIAAALVREIASLRTTGRE